MDRPEALRQEDRLEAFFTVNANLVAIFASSSCYRTVPIPVPADYGSSTAALVLRKVIVTLLNTVSISYKYFRLLEGYFSLCMSNVVPPYAAQKLQ
jgi:hypothetical protein